MRKPKREKKRIIAAVVAIVLAFIMILSALAPFIFSM